MRGFHPGAGTLTGLFALALLGHAEYALAQPTQAQQSAIRSNCRSDFMSNCSSVKPGGMEALQCLQRNMAKLSSGCKSAVSALSPPPAAAPKTAAPTTPPPAAATAPSAPKAPDTPAVAATPPAKAAPPPRQPARTATPGPAPATTTAKPTSQQQAAIKRSCQSDFMAKCRGVQPGGADALHCLQRHSSQLSGGCRKALAAIGGSRAPAASTATRSAPPPAPATAAAPADAAPPMPTPEQQSAIRFTCRADFRTLCRGVPQGGPEALACLQGNVARLTPGCRTSIAALTDDQAATVTPAPAMAPIPNRPFEGPLRRAIRDRMQNQ